jgi:hypothetical protein
MVKDEVECTLLDSEQMALGLEGNSYVFLEISRWLPPTEENGREGDVLSTEKEEEGGNCQLVCLRRAWRNVRVGYLRHKKVRK